MLYRTISIIEHSLSHLSEMPAVTHTLHHTVTGGLQFHHTALRLYGDNCTACVAPLRGGGTIAILSISITHTPKFSHLLHCIYMRSTGCLTFTKVSFLKNWHTKSLFCSFAKSLNFNTSLMKAYLLDTFKRFKRYSDTLDVKTNLCNKTWLVFNDEGEREVLFSTKMEP